jgi:hypothetical protein
MDTLPDTQTKPIDESSSEFEENEALDPRVQVRFHSFSILKTLLVIIQIELERLNHANEAINQLELQLDVISIKKPSSSISYLSI